MPRCNQEKIKTKSIFLIIFNFHSKNNQLLTATKPRLGPNLNFLFERAYYKCSQKRNKKTNSGEETHLE